MSWNDKMGIAIVIIFVSWFALHFYLKDAIRLIYSVFLLGNCKYNKVDYLYKLIYVKEFEKVDKLFISKLKVELDTYIEKCKYNNKSSIDNIITIAITALMTTTFTSYTIASQANKELVSQIMKNLNGDFSTIVYLLIVSYGVVGIFKELISSKFEYYLVVKNIIDEVEKDKPKEMNYYSSYMKTEI
ncbi:hypothetical protein [Clostridium beijerinckii]|uniref:Uncharacterized protein n=1 Tax=Clostridium beijerinckii TaxID=1520 RepID=A0AAE5H064_CLOBE|nr:hypothetical protein [Clostridium beijerinckii]NSB12139.1 hypothetical protein [Clostridium beijerinckii]OOM23059.1 hypothetical protein CLOBE_42200 [Clostridium beijerinckii]